MHLLSRFAPKQTVIGKQTTGLALQQEMDQRLRPSPVSMTVAIHGIDMKAKTHEHLNCVLELEI